MPRAVSPNLFQAQEREKPERRHIYGFDQAESGAARDRANRENWVPAEIVRKARESALGCRAHALFAAEVIDNDRRPAGAQNAPHLRHHRGGVRHHCHDEHNRGGIEGFVIERKIACVHYTQLNALEAKLAHAIRRFLQHIRRKVDSGHFKPRLVARQGKPGADADFEDVAIKLVQLRYGEFRPGPATTPKL